MARSPTYAKHAGRDAERDDDTLDLFAGAEPVKLRSKRVHRPRRPSPVAVPKVEAAPIWQAIAIEAVRLYARMVSPTKGFTMEEVRAALADSVPEPSDLRAWGTVTVMCARAGFIVKTNRYKPAVTSNGSPKPIYRRGLNA